MASAPGTIHITPSEAKRIQTRIKDRRAQCAKLAGQPRQQKPDKQALHQTITMLNLTNDMDLMGSGGGFGEEPEEDKSEGITVLAINNPYLPSTAEVGELEVMKLGDLLMETRHAGKKLRVRRREAVIELKARSWTVVKDVDGDGEDADVERLEIVLHKSKAGEDWLDSIPMGVDFTLKEPYFTLNDDCEPTLRVDHPSDVVVHWQEKILADNATGSALQRATRCKEEGNAALKRKELLDAHAQYSAGLAILAGAENKDDEETTKLTRDIHRNRAHVNLQLQRYDEAKSDGLKAVTDLPDARHKDLDSKAYFRAACAAYNLGQWQESQTLFTAQQNLSPTDKDAAANLAKLQKRIDEHSTGSYDFASLRKNLSKTRPRVDAATYDGPTERKESAKNHGSGLFATRDIKAGDLILCEKALALVWAHEKDGWTALTSDVRDGQTRVQPVGLTKNLVAKLRANLSLVPKATSLFGDHAGLGSQAVIREDGEPVVDVFQIHDIVSRNAFGPGEIFASAGSNKQAQDGRKASTGLWVRSAYINHSCIPNAAKESLGDLMLFRALRDIPAGEEITHAYSDSIDFEARAASLKTTWGFECDCRLCKAEKKDGAEVRAKRMGLMGQAEALMARDDVRIAKRVTVGRLEGLIKELEGTFNPQRWEGIPRYGVERIAEWVGEAKKGLRLK